MLEHLVSLQDLKKLFLPVISLCTQFKATLDFFTIAKKPMACFYFLLTRLQNVFLSHLYLTQNQKV